MCVCVCPCVRTCSSQHVTFLSHVRHGIQGSVAAPQRAPNPYMELEFTLICSRSPRPHLRCRDEDAQETGKGDVAAHLQLVSVSCEYLSLSSGNTNQGNSRGGTLRVETASTALVSSVHYNHHSTCAHRGGTTPRLLRARTVLDGLDFLHTAPAIIGARGGAVVEGP